MCEVLIRLLAKATGGTRPVGIYPWFYRAWAAVRKEHARKWEEANNQSFFAAAGGLSPEDVVWRSLLKNKAAMQKGEAAGKRGKEEVGVVQLVEDFKKSYENIGHAGLEEKAKRLGFPEAPLRVVMFGYKCPRRIVFEDVVSEQAFPRAGLVAGDAFATTMVKIHYLEVFVKFRDRWQKKLGSNEVEMELNLYVDDISITLRGPKPQLIKYTAEIDVDLEKVMCEELGGKKADDKTSLVASDAELWKAINATRGGRAQERPGEDFFWASTP